MCQFVFVFVNFQRILPETLKLNRRPENGINKRFTKFFTRYFTIVMITIYISQGLHTNDNISASSNFFCRERKAKEYQSEHKGIINEEWSEPSSDDQFTNFSLDRRHYKISQAVDHFRSYQDMDGRMEETHFYPVRKLILFLSFCLSFFLLLIHTFLTFIYQLIKIHFNMKDKKKDEQLRHKQNLNCANLKLMTGA